MCGIVGAIAQRNVSKILVNGLKRLEYRGYDSAGMAVIDQNKKLGLIKSVGKVQELANKLEASFLEGTIGIAHTRWATHGVPNEVNAHPHCSNNIAVIHNGIIENFKPLRDQLLAKGYEFVSETDSEVIAHLLEEEIKNTDDLFLALQNIIPQLKGAYGLAAIDCNQPDTIVVARCGSPLVIGLGIDENFIASDQLALRQVTDRFIYLEEGDFAKVSLTDVAIFDSHFKPVERQVITIDDISDTVEKGAYRHYMLKEIFEQPAAIARTLEGRISKDSVLEASFGVKAAQVFDQVESVQIIACGTSYHAGLIAKYLIEDWAGIPCFVEIASEFRYRKVVTLKNCLFVTISQSGETSDSLAALRMAKDMDYLSFLTICNVAHSSLVRESELSLMTNAGPEIGVASTKAFTTQIVALQILALVLASRSGISQEKQKHIVAALGSLPSLCEKVLKLDGEIEKISEDFVEKHHALFLGRGVQFPVALEGALKLKEISYIHAEAYAAGELKHGPLALVDSDMPVVAVAPNNELLEKLRSNLEEVQARGGILYVFADENAGFKADENTIVFDLPHVPACLEPIVYTLPLQLLSYHVAVSRGTDVDQPRNLAKSVTVE